MGHLTDALQDVRTVVAQIQADWTAYPLNVELDNRDSVDFGTQTNPFLMVTVEPLGGGQADMADHPQVEQTGQILLTVAVRGGSGSVKAAELLDFILPYFSMKDFTTLRTRAAVATRPKEANGWWHVPAIVEYWYHHTSN